MLKTVIESIRLSVETKKNCLPGGKEFMGSIRISKDMSVAKFKEEEILHFSGPQKHFRLYKRQNCNVTLNTETQKYRISVYIDPKEIHWPAQADDAFYRCMDWLAERTNA